MQYESSTSSEECSFCQSDTIAPYLLQETPTFRIIADHAPLVAGHMLIVPKAHYACYGDVPAELDQELFALKGEVQKFLTRFYAPAVYWEHGVFHQTVFHAHLHCFPFDETHYQLSQGLHDLVVHSQDDIRHWYQTKGQYFYLEDRRHSLLFAPNSDSYMRIIQEVFLPAVVARTGNARWRTSQQRQQEGVALIAALKEKWQIFHQQRVTS